MRRSNARGRRRARPGFTFLEVQVAFVLLGIGLAGLCPLVVMQLRLSRLLARANAQGRESDSLNTYLKRAPRLTPATPYLWPHPFDPANPDRTYFLVPEPNPWLRRLGDPAALQTDPPPPAGSKTPPPYVVQFTGPAALAGDSVRVGLTITKRSAP